MKAELNTQVILTLEEDEAYWLKTVMQNPLFGREPSEESKEDKTMRYDIFNCVNDVLLEGN